MDTRNFVGPKATTLYVSLVTAGGQEAEARLGISATILSDIVLNPGTIDFGAVARGQAPSADAHDRPRRTVELEGRADGLGQQGD